MRPTDATYDELQKAFDHFNGALFSGRLPACLITLQREKRTMGYFSAQRFVHLGDAAITDEIAMNPVHFGIVPIAEVMQTLVHEMVHLWQFHFGSPGRVRYHNEEWAAKMESIGLMPSDTAQRVRVVGGSPQMQRCFIDNRHRQLPVNRESGHMANART